MLVSLHSPHSPVSSACRSCVTKKTACPRAPSIAARLANLFNPSHFSAHAPYARTPTHSYIRPYSFFLAGGGLAACIQPPLPSFTKRGQSRHQVTRGSAQSNPRTARAASCESRRGSCRCCCNQREISICLPRQLSRRRQQQQWPWWQSRRQSWWRKCCPSSALGAQVLA
jgi:hypothetical protein